MRLLPFSSSRRLVVVALLLPLLAMPVRAAAQGCDADTEARLEFLEARLDEGQGKARLWWRAWMGVFTIGAVFSAISGATQDDGSNKAADFFNAGKSLLGIGDLMLRPHAGRHGAERVRAIPKDSAESCRQRLALAEKSMEDAAKQGGEVWSWKSHASSLALNLAVALAVSEGWSDEGDAWRDFGVSTVSGELHLWTHPTRAVDDLADYREKFDRIPASAAAPRGPRLAAGPLGLRLRWDF